MKQLSSVAFTEAVKLSKVKAGSCFIYPTTALSDAIKEEAVFMVVGTEKNSRIQFANVFDGLLMERDSDFPVVPVTTGIVIGGAAETCG